MIVKMDLVLAQLLKGFPDQAITYRSDSSFDNFHIENNGFTHCLCISKEFSNVSDKVMNNNMINAMYHIVDVFKIAKSPMRLLLTNDGIKEVVMGYCK